MTIPSPERAERAQTETLGALRALYSSPFAKPAARRPDHVGVETRAAIIGRRRSPVRKAEKVDVSKMIPAFDANGNLVGLVDPAELISVDGTPPSPAKKRLAARQTMRRQMGGRTPARKAIDVNVAPGTAPAHIFAALSRLHPDGRVRVRKAGRPLTFAEEAKAGVAAYRALSEGQRAPVRALLGAAVQFDGTPRR